MILDYLKDQIPDYSGEMYLKGYKPEQILMAHRRMMLEDLIEDSPKAQIARLFSQEASEDE